MVVNMAADLGAFFPTLSQLTGHEGNFNNELNQCKSAVKEIPRLNPMHVSSQGDPKVESMHVSSQGNSIAESTHVKAVYKI